MAQKTEILNIYAHFNSRRISPDPLCTPFAPNSSLCVLQNGHDPLLLNVSTERRDANHIYPLSHCTVATRFKPDRMSMYTIFLNIFALHTCIIDFLEAFTPQLFCTYTYYTFGGKFANFNELYKVNEFFLLHNEILSCRKNVTIRCYLLQLQKIAYTIVRELLYNEGKEVSHRFTR